MRYLASYLLAVLGGKDNPTAADIEKILASVGISVEKDKINKVVSELKGKNIEELIEQGKEKLSTVPAGGGAAAPVAAAAVAAPVAEAPAAAKEEKKPAKEESESDDDMGFGLFD